jgi:hypothetical protein
MTHVLPGNLADMVRRGLDPQAIQFPVPGGDRIVIHSSVDSQEWEDAMDQVKLMRWGKGMGKNLQASIALGF